MPSARRIDDKTIAIGNSLSEDETNVLLQHSPTGEDILNSLDSLNEEIAESHSDFLEQTPKKEKPVPSPVARPVQPRRIPRALQAERELAETMPTPEPKDDFDEVLGDVETAPEEIFSSDETRKDTIMKYLKDLKGAPIQAQINAWKQEYGENGVNLIVFDEKNVFIYTYLKTGQFRKLRDKIEEIARTQNQAAEDTLKEKVVQYCTLWPKLQTEFFYTSRAGILESLYNAIWTESYFLNPQQVQMLTVQL